MIFAVLDVWIGHSYTVLWTGKVFCLHLIFAVLLTTSTFIALPVPEILGGYTKMLGVTWQGLALFLAKK